jgi:mRNA interferase RelE/StbE
VGKYSVEIKASAQKELDALDDVRFARIDAKIVALADDPQPHGCKKLKGFKDTWRIRIGDFRVVFVLNHAKKVVTITRVAHRREVY